MFFFVSTNYNVKINAQSSIPGVTVSRVQYSTNGRNWTTGSSFTSASKPSTVYVRVTDSNGGVTNFTYANGATTKN